MADIGASIRNPAHYCGIFGHKPTHGVVTFRGMALPGMLTNLDIAVLGPLTRSAADLDLRVAAEARRTARVLPGRCRPRP